MFFVKTRIEGLLCVLAVAAIAGGCSRQVEEPPPTPEPPAVTAEQSWENYVSRAREECAREPGCSVDFEKLYEYDGRYFGVMVVGVEDSEYWVTLERYSPKTDEWVLSPTAESEGFRGTDVPATSEEWNIPTEVINQWLEEAETTVQAIYAKRNQPD